MKVALYNLSPRVSDDEANAMAQAWAIQLNSDYAREHGLPENVGRAEIDYLGRDESAATADAPPTGYDERHVLFGAAAQAGELGDHGQDPTGHPYLRTFVDALLDNGCSVLGDPAQPTRPSVSTVGSHEVLEAQGDPDVNDWVDCPPISLPSGKIATSTPRELADAVEGTSYPITAAGKTVMVSDFLYRAWFNPTPGPAGTLYSRCGAAPGPFKLAPGGYCVGRSAGPGTEEITFGEAYAPGHVGPPAFLLEMRAAAKGRSWRRKGGGR